MTRLHSTNRPIICGIDDSEASRKAASVAARLAQDLGCAATLVHVVDPQRQVTIGSSRPGGLRTRKLRRELALVAKSHGFPARTEVRIESGDAADTLIGIAVESAAELIVTGTRGLGDVTSALLGGVSSALMRAAPCPVVVVPPDAVRLPDSGPLPAIVCGVEDDEDDVRVLRLAEDLAGRLSARLHAVHAYDAWAVRAAPVAPAPPVEVDLRDAAERTLLNALEEADVRAASEHTLALPPDLALRRVASEERAGLIVVGARDRSRLSALLHGSVPVRLAAEGSTALVVLPASARLDAGNGHYEVAAAA